MNGTCNNCMDLHKLHVCGKMNLYLTHGKGGNNDCYGRVTNCTGGSKDTASIQRYGMAIVAREAANRLSGIRFLAHSSRRFAKVSGLAKTTSRITEANLFGLPVLHSLRISWSPLSSELVSSTSCYFSTMAMRLERVYISMLCLIMGDCYE
jgi:hypothetical protein